MSTCSLVIVEVLLSRPAFFAMPENRPLLPAQNIPRTNNVNSAKAEIQQ